MRSDLLVTEEEAVFLAILEQSGVCLRSLCSNLDHCSKYIFGCGTCICGLEGIGVNRFAKEKEQKRRIGLVRRGPSSELYFWLINFCSWS